MDYQRRQIRWLKPAMRGLPVVGLALATSLIAQPVRAESPATGQSATPTSATESAKPPSAVTIIKQMKAAFEPSQPTRRLLTIDVRTDNETVTWQVGQAFKPSAAGNQMLTAILVPAELKGNVFLVREQSDGPSVMWVYSPTVRRVREIVPVDAYERFMGTDFTYADLGLVRLHEHYRLLGKEQHQGVQAYKIEESSEGQRDYYSRILIWVAVDSMLPLERDYYDRAGELWKQEQFAHAREVNGMPIPLRIIMSDVQTKTQTTLSVKDVQANGQIPDEVFEPKNLPTAASHLLWQTHPSADPKEQ